MRPLPFQNAISYCTVRVKLVLCESVALVAVTVTVNLPVGVPVTTLKFTGLDAPPPGAGFATTTGKVPVAARSSVVRAIEICDALVYLTA
jgi:hypothetical protein